MKRAKGNIIYTIFLVVSIPLILFFMVYPLVKAGMKTVNYTEDYNTAMTINSYRFKFSEAVYITDTKQFVVSLSVLQEAGANEKAKPYMSKFIAYDKKKNQNAVTDGFEYKPRNDISQYVYVQNVEDNFRYVETYATSTVPEYQDPATKDAFGDEVPGEIHKAVSDTKYCRIDRKDVRFITSDEAEKLLVMISNESEDMSILSENDTLSTGDTSYIDVDINMSYDITSELSSADTSSSSSLTSSLSSSESSQNDSHNSNNSTAPNDNNGNNDGNNGNGGSNNSGGNGGGGNNEPEPYEPPQTTAAPQTTQPPQTTPEPPQTTAPHTTRPPETTQPQAVHPNRIYLETDFENNNVVLNIGSETQLRAIVEPDNAADKSVRWSCNKAGIIEIDSEGKVKAIAKGKVIVTAETNDGGLKASCMVTVN